MRSVKTLTTATLVAATVFGGLGTASTAQATTKEEVAINGTFRATSIGDWAQRNDQYFGEPTVYQIWTISSTCDDIPGMPRHGDERPGMERARLYE